MSAKDNPYGGAGGQYSTSVQFGSGEAPAPAADAAEGLLGAVSQAAPADLIKETTTQAFAADVLQESSNQPVLVDFWAPWCGPCRQLTPALEKVVRQAGGQVKLVKMNIDDHPAIAGQLGIQSIPAVIAFKDGKPVDAFMGAVPESQIKAFIDRLGGPGGNGGNRIDEALEAARQSLDSGDHAMAARIFSAVLEQDPENVEALAGMAETSYEAGDIAGAEAILERVPEADKDKPAIAAVRAKLKLAEQFAELADHEELEERLAKNPKDHQARFDLALVLNAMNQREAAADALLEIIRADRGWNDEAARNQLLQFFEAWGMGDEATLSARRKLSSLLFS